MLEITVRKDGAGDYCTLTEAVNAVPCTEEAVIDLGEGVYREKVFCEKRQLTIRGAGRDKTKVIWGDGGKMPHPDGRPIHTFRTYTMFFGGEHIKVEGLTIENDAGPGALVGQGIAAYVDARRAEFEDVALLGHQDTLFCAPLPEKEREKNGFLGPRMRSPRLPSRQYYHNCEITGEVDFIFGGGDALFEDCLIRSVYDGRVSYVAAPSGHADGTGLVFHRCKFVSDGPEGTVYLARPWRPEGKTAVLFCELGGHIHPDGFSPWNDRSDTHLASFSVCGNSGAGSSLNSPWTSRLSPAESDELLRRSRAEG